MDAMTDEFHDEASYGALLADEYDAIYGDVFDTEGAVDSWLDWRMAAGSSNSAWAQVASPSHWPKRVSMCGASTARRTC